MPKLYEVGGSIRNELLWLPVRDVDYAIEVKSFEEFYEWVQTIRAIIVHEQKEFGSYKLRLTNKRVVDVTFCRTDDSYSDGRHPDEVKIGTLETDLQRRDFTMNALAIQCDTLSFARLAPFAPVVTFPIIDLVGGQEDLAFRVIRCVGDARQRLYEDPLRLLRAIRFHVTLGFHLHEDIITLLMDCRLVDRLFETVSRERIASEVSLCLPHMYRFIECLRLYPYLGHEIMSCLEWKVSCKK